MAATGLDSQAGGLRGPPEGVGVRGRSPRPLFWTYTGTEDILVPVSPCNCRYRVMGTWTRSLKSTGTPFWPTLLVDPPLYQNPYVLG